MENRDGPSSCLFPEAAAAEPHDSASASSLAVADARLAPNPGAAAGARKRKAPAAAARKPRKQQAEEPIQMPVYYGKRQDFRRVKGHDLVYDCSGSREEKCAHVIGELLLQPQTMSFVDLQLWIFRMFRLHPETQDLDIKGFLQQRTIDFDDSEPEEYYFEDYSWDTHSLDTDKCWRSFVNKLKRKRNVVQRFMLYVESPEIKHYDVLLRAVNDDAYCRLETAVLPGTECLTISRFSFCNFVQNLQMTSKEIVAYIAQHYGEQISLLEAWRARQKGLEWEFGTYYDSHNLAPRLLKEIVRKNPGGFVDIKDVEVAGFKDFRVLQRMFWAFGQCLQAFRTCRPVLCIKGMPLCGKYKGVLVTAVALDANDFTIPVAFAIIEGETRESWLWFLRNLEQAVVHPSDICIIHDYKSELINAVEDLLRSRERKWMSAESRWCMEHLAENFLEYFSDTKLVTMFKKLCQKKRRHTFVKIWKELDELTSKYMAEKEGCASGGKQPESVKHDENSVVDGGEAGHADDRTRSITNFSDWISLKPKEKWSLLHDKKGARYGIMGTDIADVYKNDPVLRGVTCLPLSAIVEVTFLRLAEYFEKTSVAANKAIGNPIINFPARVQDDMNSKMQKAEMHQVTYTVTYTDDRNVHGREQDRKFTVKSGKRLVTVNLNSEYIYSMHKSEESEFLKIATCTCKKPQLLHKPCSHLITVCCQIGVKAATYMSPYYSLAYLVNTWRKEFIVCKTSRDIRSGIMPFGFDTPTWIPDKKLECGPPVFLSSDSNVVDNEEQKSITENGSIQDNQATSHSEEPTQV